MVHRPRVPAPMTTAVISLAPEAGPDSAPWTAHAVGSTITAASSVNAWGTGCNWLLWATRARPQPPPVSAQYPVWRPGWRWPYAMLRQRLVAPVAQEAHGGSMPRAEHRSTGSRTARL